MALGAALLMPLRDDRRGKRATFDAGRAPLNVDFRAVASLSVPLPLPDQDGRESRPEPPPDVTSFEAPHDLGPDAMQRPLASCEPESPVLGPENVETTVAETPAAASRGAEPSYAGARLRLSVRAIFEPLRTMLQTLRLRRDEDGTGSEREESPWREANVENASFAEQVAALSSPAITEPVREPESVSLGEQRNERFDQAPRASFVERAPEAPLGTERGSTDDPVVSATSSPLIVHVQRPPYERAVPLTRLPLRSRASAITWYALAAASQTTMTRAQRHTLLSELAKEAGATSGAALMLAYREEDTEGRILAMRALMRRDADFARPVFEEALRLGTDEERALAIDGLVAQGATDALVPAFSDRVEAIAAKAALAYVGTQVADDYRRALAPFIDEPRVEALISLLAGFLR